MAGLLVHEWIEERGGSERVLDAVAESFPSADILCLWNDNPAAYPGRNVKETWLSRTPLRRSKPLALPFMPSTWRHQANDGYDWTFVSSHLFAHHIRLDSRVPIKKFVYVHTPARYIWTPELDERGRTLIPRLMSRSLKTLDRYRSREATSIAANSAFVQDRIASTWQADSTVIYPPVDVSDITSVADWSSELSDSEQDQVRRLPADFVLGASRFVKYKRLDLVIEAGEASHLPVVLAGSGPLLAELQERAAEASVPVIILQNPSDALIRYLYQVALVYVFPPIEDFGIMPVEAMALGTPVVANSIGGASESVVDGETGSLFRDSTKAALRSAVETAAELNADDCRRRAKVFSKERFQNEVTEWMGVDGV